MVLESQDNALEPHLLLLRDPHRALPYLFDEETTADGIARWQVVETEQRVSVARLGNEIAELQAQEKAAQTTIKSESELWARLTTERAQGLRYLGEGEAQREALAQMPILRQAADAEVADPESPALPTALDRMMMSAEREISHSDVRLAELRAIRSSIEETGVAGSSRDVDWVVSALKSLGVRSAQPYNRYIAGALPDSDKARTLVASNPSRFAGVCVAASEFEKARGITEIPLSLTAPVMVSTAALDAEPGRSDAIVLSAEDDARFNVEAAKVLLVSLEKQATDEEARRAAQVCLRDDAWNGKQKVHAFLERYSAVKMQEARVKTEQQALDITAASERINQAEQTVTECQTQVGQRQKACQEALSAAEDAKRATGDIAQYQQTHELDHVYRRARLQEIDDALKVHWERRSEIDVAKAGLEDLKGKAIRQQLVLEAAADRLAQERGQLKHVDKAFPAKETLEAQPESLVTLRDRHWTAVETLETQEKLRLGLLQQRLEQAREAVTTKTLAFTKQFGGVVRSEVTPYMGLDFEQAIPAVEHDIEAADKVLRGKESQLAVENSRLADFRLKHPPAFAPTETMLALEGEALTARIDLAEKSHQACLEEVESSREEAKKARRLALEAEQDAKLAQKHTRTLTTQLQQNRVNIELFARLNQSSRKRVPLQEVRRAFFELRPETANNPDRNALLLADLRGLEVAKLIQLPAAGSWEKRGNPPMPNWIQLVRTEEAPHRDYAAVSWVPELGFWPELKCNSLEAAFAINEFLLTRRGTLRQVPIKERSLQIFGDEKRLDYLRTGDTLFAGRLRLSTLGAFQVPLPLPYRQAEAPGKPVLVLENHNSFWSFGEWNHEACRYAAVVYGAGEGFRSSGRALGQVLQEVDGVDVEYLGDLDPTGVQIPLDFNTAIRGEPKVKPATPFYQWLLGHGIRRPLDTESNTHSMIIVAQEWLGVELGGLLASLWTDGFWMPQEGLGIEALNDHFTQK